MSGNLWEWCQDWYADDYYKHSPKKNPTGPKSNSGYGRVLRGGSWISYAASCEVSNRYRSFADDRYNSFGFRLAYSL